MLKYAGKKKIYKKIIYVTMFQEEEKKKKVIYSEIMEDNPNFIYW